MSTNIFARMVKSVKEASKMFERMTPVVERITDSNEESLFDLPVSSNGGPPSKPKKEAKKKLLATPTIKKEKKEKKPKQKRSGDSAITKEDINDLFFAEKKAEEEQLAEQRKQELTDEECAQMIHNAKVIGGLILVTYGLYQLYKLHYAQPPPLIEDLPSIAAENAKMFRH